MLTLGLYVLAMFGIFGRRREDLSVLGEDIYEDAANPTADMQSTDPSFIHISRVYLSEKRHCTHIRFLLVVLRTIVIISLCWHFQHYLSERYK